MNHLGVSYNEGYHFGIPLKVIIVLWGLDWGAPTYGTSTNQDFLDGCALNSCGIQFASGRKGLGFRV